MKTLFALCIIIGVIWSLLQWGAGSAPKSMILILAGVVGIVCVSFFP